MWARLHKVDRVRPRPDGSAIVLVEDERNLAGMALVPSLSVVVAVARVLNARRLLDVRFGGKGEVRYAAAPALPETLLDAVTRAGASATDASGDTIRAPAAPAAVSAVVDQAFATLAYHLRAQVGAADPAGALRVVEARRRTAALDRDASPAPYWTAVLELCALAGEVARPRGARWVDTVEVPVPFALRFPDGATATPSRLAIQVVEGTADASLAVTGS